jgi:cytochrome c oxidase assembly protein subunit 17
MHTRTVLTGMCAVQKARDACIIEKGEADCAPLIDAHKTCMRNLGFDV